MSRFQTLQRVEAAFTKAGAVIQPRDYGSGYRATKGNRVIEYFAQAGFPDETKKIVTQMFSPSPYTDTRTDCYCDRYFYSITAAVAELNRA